MLAFNLLSALQLSLTDASLYHHVLQFISFCFFINKPCSLDPTYDSVAAFGLVMQATLALLAKLLSLPAHFLEYFLKYKTQEKTNKLHVGYVKDPLH